MGSPFSSDARRRAHEEDRHWKAKAVLRLVAVVLALVAMSLFAASVSFTNREFTDSEGQGDWTDGLALAPVVFALLYNAISLLATFGLRGGQPLHPSIHLALDAIVWALSLPGTILAIAGGIFWYWTDPVPSADGTIDCKILFNIFAAECSEMVYRIGKMEIAGAVFLGLLFLIHFALFAMDLSALLRARRAATLALHSQGFDMRVVKDVERGSSSHSSRR